MEDCNLSDAGRVQLNTDRSNFYPQAPFSPGIFNVPNKPDVTTDVDNYRNDLLKQYCKNVSSSGGRYDTAFDTMKQYGQKKKGGGAVSSADVDSAINEVTKDTTDAVGQVKYLLCQQADGLIAPPRPIIVPHGTSADQLLEQAYDGWGSYAFWTGIFFAILSILLIVNYLVRLFKSQNLSKPLFWGFLIGGILMSLIWAFILGSPYCYDMPNDYYNAETASGVGYTLWIYGIILVIGLISFGIGVIFRKVNFFYIGLAIPLLVLFSWDIWLALFKPQIFILMVIIWRIFANSVWGESLWSMPLVSAYGRLATRIITPLLTRFGLVTRPDEQFFGISNDQAFRPFA